MVVLVIWLKLWQKLSDFKTLMFYMYVPSELLCQQPCLGSTFLPR